MGQRAKTTHWTLVLFAGIGCVLHDRWARGWIRPLSKRSLRAWPLVSFDLNPCAARSTYRSNPQIHIALRSILARGPEGTIRLKTWRKDLHTRRAFWQVRSLLHAARSFLIIGSPVASGISSMMNRTCASQKMHSSVRSSRRSRTLFSAGIEKERRQSVQVIT